MKKRIIVEVISFLSIILFLYTAISKLIEFDVFREQIGQSNFLSPLSNVIAWLLPSAEIITAILLFFPATRLKGLYAALCLMSVFTVYVMLILIFQNHLPCSCGGIIGHMTWQQHLLFNSIMVWLEIVAIRFQTQIRNSSRVDYQPA
jgi:hypothetical protein